MTISTEKIGTVDGTDIYTYAIQVPDGIRMELCNFGAALIGLSIPAGGKAPVQTVCGFDSLEGIRRNPAFFGVTVGPVANRIAGASFQLDGKQYKLENNEGANTLHSGLGCSFAYKAFSAECFESDDAAGVVFRYTRPDGEGGFPGTLEFAAHYWVTSSNELIMYYTAKTDDPTPINATNHTYWNLNGAGSGDITRHTLQLNADRYLPVNAESLPVGKEESVSDAMDFREPKKIGKDIDNAGAGYDHCYILQRSNTIWQPSFSGESMQNLPRELRQILETATASNPQTGRMAEKAAEVHADTAPVSMEVFTDQAALQFYSGNMLPPEGITGRDGIVFTPRTAFCVETQDYIDAMSNEDFPSIILQPEETYHRTTIHRFHWHK